MIVLPEQQQQKKTRILVTKCECLSTLSVWLNLELRSEQPLDNLYEETCRLGKWKRKTHLECGQQHFIE